MPCNCRRPRAFSLSVPSTLNYYQRYSKATQQCSIVCSIDSLSSLTRRVVVGLCTRRFYTVTPTEATCRRVEYSTTRSKACAVSLLVGTTTQSSHSQIVVTAHAASIIISSKYICHCVVLRQMWRCVDKSTVLRQLPNTVVRVLQHW